MYETFENSLLIVDDMRSNRLTDRAIIETHFPKLTIYEANSAKAALEVMEQHAIDLVLSDIMMPDMDGFELAKEMQEHFHEGCSPIIFITASSESQLLEKQGIEIGAIDFIQRPFHPNTLVNKIKLYLNLYRKNQELQRHIRANEMSLEIIDRYVIMSKTDLRGIITDVTNAFCEISGFTREEMVGKPHNIVRHPDMDKAVFKDLWQSIKKGKIWSGEVKNRRKNGTFYWVHAVISPMIDAEGNHIGYISTRQDITESKRQQLELEMREEQLQAETASRKEAEDLVYEVIDTTSNMVVVTTQNEPIFFNQAMLKFLHVESIELFRANYKNFDDFFMQHPNILEDVDMGENWLETMLNIDQDTPISLRAPGTLNKRMYTLQVKRLQTKEERYFFSFTDVTDLEDERQYFEKMATHDNLTGIYNRFFFIDATKRGIKVSMRDERPMSLMMIDIDHFKSVNDTFGHDVGDMVLKAFATTINQRLRDSDIFARWGGEEFTVALPSTTLENAQHVAQEIRKNIQQSNFPEVGQITCSIGVSTLREDDTFDDLVKRADMGLYEAKAAGRNCVKVADL